MFENNRINLSVGFVLLFSTLFFFDGSGIISALIPAVAAHELGHVFALKFVKARITGLYADMSGLRINYSGVLSQSEEFLVLSAGPAAGIVYCFTASYLGKALGSDFFLCSSGISAVLTAYNCLPANPLDGGGLVAIALSRIGKEETAALISLLLSFLSASLLTLSGAYFFRKGLGAALLLSGIWIFGITIKSACKRE